MSPVLSKSCTAVDGDRLLLSGTLAEVATAVQTASKHAAKSIMVFDNATGRVIDLDLRGTETELIERLSNPSQSFAGRYRSPANEQSDPPDTKGPGRPKLGVVSREVTLLPQQWEWLAAQSGGASATLRRLVNDARRNSAPLQERRAAQQAAYQFMLAMAGDRPGYEEATRALFADDRVTLEKQIAGWPEDIRKHALCLAFDRGDTP